MYPIIPFWVKTADQKWHELSMSQFPRCTQFLSYSQFLSHNADSDIHGTFTFDTIHLSRAVRDHLKGNAWDGRVTVRDSDFWDWLKGRDRECEETTILPSAWPGIEILVFHVIEAGEFKAWCHQCARQYEPKEVQPQPRQERVGTIYERLACPQGHVLLKVEIMHIVATGEPKECRGLVL